MLVLNNTPFVHARVYLQYLNSALPGDELGFPIHICGLTKVTSSQIHNIIQIHNSVKWD
jgi:hypothetical protein